MKHILRIAALGKFPEIDISPQEYDDYKYAHCTLVNALAIEEKYEIVLHNYVEFERKAISAATEFMIRGNYEYEKFFNVRFDLNVCIVNLLTAARLYIDQMSHNVKECCESKEETGKTVKNIFTEQYNSNIDYRFMDALRNYVQHRGLPVHRTGFDSSWTSEEENRFMEFGISIAVDRNTLMEDSAFKQKVLYEIDEKVDLRLASRSYMESISRIQEKVRKLIRPATESARSLFEDAHKKYKSAYSGELIALSAGAWEKGTLVESVPLLLDWDDIRITLQKRNRELVNMKKRYVTSRPKSFKKAK